LKLRQLDLQPLADWDCEPTYEGLKPPCRNQASEA